MSECYIVYKALWLAFASNLKHVKNLQLHNDLLRETTQDLEQKLFVS